MLIGAGGIGCELIKDLALLRIGEVTIVDLDTIDVSNLNRQFLFRREHVGKPKAQIAAEAAQKLNPSMKVSFLCDNVKNFNHTVIASFDVVLSALDNIDARRHLNRVCLTAGRPLIEAGSTGYIGQSRIIIKDVSECYECQKKEAPKVFPVCTIRSAPSTPIHCIQWAKLLFELLFGASDESSIIKDQHIKSDSAFDYLKHLFHDDIISQSEIKEKWITRPPPIPLDLQDAQIAWDGIASDTLMSESQKVLPLVDYVKMFLSSVRTILSERSDLIGQLCFSKDDPISVDFVAAASNLRMFNYQIPMKSRWDIESIAGAIVPAIATTNAIVAGLQSFNLGYALRGDTGRDLWIRYPHPSGNGSIVQSSKPPGPNKECFICQNQMVTVSIKDYSQWSLNSLVEVVIKGILLVDKPVIIKDENLIFDALEDDEDMVNQYSENLVFWDFSRNAQLIQIEDPSTNETLHMTVKEDCKSPDSVNGHPMNIVENSSGPKDI